jgi:hypothetical protein
MAVRKNVKRMNIDAFKSSYVQWQSLEAAHRSAKASSDLQQVADTARKMIPAKHRFYAEAEKLAATAVQRLEKTP